jgi:hypothetical protein
MLRLDRHRLYPPPQNGREFSVWPRVKRGLIETHLPVLVHGALEATGRVMAWAGNGPRASAQCTSLLHEMVVVESGSSTGVAPLC